MRAAARWTLWLLAGCGRHGFADAPDAATEVDAAVHVPIASCPETIVLGAAATCAPDAIRITPATMSSVGAVYLQTPVSTAIATELVVDLQLRLAGTGDGAVVVFHGDARGTTAIGNYGANLGYNGISPSIGIELDTYINTPLGEPGPYSACGLEGDSDHVGINVDGVTIPSVLTAPAPFDLEHVPFWVRIRYSAAEQLLAVTVDRTSADAPPLLTTSIDLTRLGPSMWIGATGGTGCDVAAQDILAWSYSVR